MPVRPSDPAAHAAQLLERGELTAAERSALNILAREENPDALHVLALVRLKQNRAEEALMLLQRSLAVRPGHAGVLFHLGQTLSQARRDAEAVPALKDALLWQPGMAEAWYELGEVLHRLGDFAGAENAFRQLLALQPGHLLGKLALGLALKEAGQPGGAESQFAEGLAQSDDSFLKAAFAYNLALVQCDLGRNEAALANFTLVSRLDPDRSAGELACAAILEEMQRSDEAALLLEALIRRQPLNEAAHEAYNDLLYRHGRDDEFLKSYDDAPHAAPLQLGKANFLLKTGRKEEAQALYAAIAAREPDNLNAVLGAVGALSRLGRHGEAFAALEQALACHPNSLPLYRQLAVTALETRDPQKAAAMAQKALALAPWDQYGLAIQGTAWRMLGDARDEILNGYDELIAVFDLEPPAGFSGMADFNAELAGLLDRIHPSTRAPLEQTLRGGSQTRGHLFGAGHELVEMLKGRIAQAVQAYIAGIRHDARHPFRGRKAEDFRFTGSWSSRLRDQGFHVNHIHPEGWISSCYYVRVPEAAEDQKEKQGWIKFGEPSFQTGLSPRRTIQPEPGRLVLFPSYMWHGTIPFHGDVRTTIAFDAVPAAP
jgi:tetratricopeptide (TPR) repeat protein